MKKNLNPKDTVITIRHKQFDQCHAKGHCPNHPNKLVVFHSEQTPKDELQVDTSSIDTAVHDVQIEKVEVQKIGKKEIEETVVLSDFDTIESVSDQLVQIADVRLSNQTISIPEVKNPDPVTSSFDIECLSLTFGFVVFLSVKYAINSASNWTSMFSEIKQIVNS
jgi:hypothetical protein